MYSRTLNNILVTVSLALIPAIALAQVSELKEEAKAAFQAENYPLAISLLKRAIAENPDDAEAYYYLGYYTHYLCYDSIPLTGYGRDLSDEVLRLLRRAVTLNPSLGNGFYFIGAEYGARFLNSMKTGNLDEMVVALREGRREGGFPEWLIEYNRNMLKSCEPNAILFTGGDADTDPAWYLQYLENVRRDVTVIPFALLNRPWFVSILKEGDGLIPTPAPISWSREQILSLRPYKWKANTITIPLSNKVRAAYQLPDTTKQMEWMVQPDLRDDYRTYLSGNYAVMVDIIRTNAWRRPVYFSLGSHMETFKGLEDYLQISGFSLRLLPVKSGEEAFSLDVEKTEQIMLDIENFKDIEDVATKDYSRIASLLGNYRIVFLNLLEHYQEVDNKDKLREAIRIMEAVLPEHVLPMHPTFAEMIARFKQEIGIPPDLHPSALANFGLLLRIPSSLLYEN